MDIFLFVAVDVRMEPLLLPKSCRSVDYGAFPSPRPILGGALRTLHSQAITVLDKARL